ncbi:MAG: AmiS/UreI family transporter [Mobilicoccus sp.]|nr:AmiS/UreI family transporter [Mobilicoccus sp.]
MADIGLFYVGAVLLVNGVMLLGGMTPKAAAPLNLFVGLMQVFTPTYLVLTSGGDAATVLGAAGLYLFGFTYLWVGINALGDLPGTGLGWFSLFVAVAATAYAVVTWQDGGRVFTVIWLCWALLWLLFFLVLALERAELTRFTGGVAIAAGVLTAALPAWLSLTGLFQDSAMTALIAAVVALLVLAGVWVVTRPQLSAGVAH